MGANGRTKGRPRELKKELMNEKMNGLMYELTDGQKNRQTDNKMVDLNE